MTNDGSPTLPLQTVVDALDKLLRPDEYQDYSWNGVQVEAGSTSIARVGVAVDAGLSVIEKAIQESCDLLVTHHGLFWGKCSPCITGPMGKKVRTLLEGNCSLYVSHLPLDGNLRVGNAACIAELLELADITPSFLHEGSTIGTVGKLQSPLEREKFAELVFSRVTPPKQESLTLDLSFGSAEVQTVGIATGSASGLIPEAKALGCDVFITGEPKQEAYHTAKEEGMNVIFAGHYHTETFGVKAVGKYLEEELKISSVFLDEPTGI